MLHIAINEHWDEEKNISIFGKCANQNWRGHNYELHVTVKGKAARNWLYYECQGVSV